MWHDLVLHFLDWDRLDSFFVIFSPNGDFHEENLKRKHPFWQAIFRPPWACPTLYVSRAALSFIEYATPAIHHAPGFFLTQIDRMHETFLEEIGMSAHTALLLSAVVAT